MTVLLILVIIIIFLIDGMPLIPKKQWAELTVLSVLLALSCFLFIGKSVGWPVTLNSLNDLLNGWGKKWFG